MVVVLCDGYYECQQSYEIFKDWMLHHESWTVTRYYDHCNGIVTNDGFIYIFIDTRLVNLFVDSTDSIIYVQELFDEIMTDDYDEREAYKYWIRER